MFGLDCGESDSRITMIFANFIPKILLMKSETKEKILVTGADGMLGSSICRELLLQGYEVQAMVLKGSLLTVLDGLPLNRMEGDILDVATVREAMAGCDAVIHAAASTSVWPSRSAKVMQVNVDGTMNVMSVGTSLNIRRMVHIGTASSFCEGPREHPGDETCCFSGGKFGMDYIDSKYEAQKLLIEHHLKSAFPVIVVNPTYMIGPFDSGPSSGKMLIALAKNSLPGYSGGGKNFVCSKDVAVAAVNALRLGRLGECYIAGGENLEWGEFLRIACEVMGKKFALIRMPDFLIKGVALGGTLWSRIAGKAPKLSYPMARVAGVKQFYSPKKAVDELEMPQTPIRTGIEESVAWFRENGYM